MARFGARPPYRRDLLRIPQFRLRHEIEAPGVPLLCTLLPLAEADPAVEVVVNRSYGLLGYKHAAFHVDHPPVGPRVCWVGLDCGYVDTGDEDDGLDWGDDVDGERNGSTWVDGVT